MKRLFTLAAAALVALTASTAEAGPLCCGDRCHCIQPPCEKCPDCSDPCCGYRMRSLCGPEHAQKLIETLCSCDCCCERIRAATKLGSRIHADYCACPDILEALVKALTCDTCWEVRRAAAWSIAMQDARVPLGVAALYIASKADKHYLVRDRATDALSILIRCRKDCYKDLFRAADVLIARIKPDYNPTNGNCVNLVLDLVSHGDVVDGAPVLDAPPVAVPKVAEPVLMPKGAELIAPPKDEKKDEAKEEKKDDKEEKKEDK